MQCFARFVTTMPPHVAAQPWLQHPNHQTTSPDKPAVPGPLMRQIAQHDFTGYNGVANRSSGGLFTDAIWK